MMSMNENPNELSNNHRISQLNITPHLHTCQRASLIVICKVGFVNEPDKKQSWPSSDNTASAGEHYRYPMA